jgi:hypothetical protein
MTSLQTQYDNYLKENPTSTLTYDEWMEQIWEPIISENFQTDSDEDMSDWDNTLMDGLDDEDDFM